MHSKIMSKTKLLLILVLTAMSVLAFSLSALNTSVKADTELALAITTAPTKVVYNIGDTFDPTGLVVELSDGSIGTIAYSDETKGDFTFDTVTITSETKIVKVTYAGCTADIPVSVNNSIYKASLLLNEDISIKFYFDATTATDVKATFNFNGSETVVTDYKEENDNKISFLFDKVTPVYLGKGVDVTLTGIVDGEEVILGQKLGYSVKAYCDYVLSAEAEEDLQLDADELTKLRNLVADILNYGAAAQLYTDIDANNLVNADVSSEYGNEFVSPQSTDLEITGEDSASYAWYSVNLRFGYRVGIVYKFLANDVSNLTLKVDNNGNVQTFTAEDFETVGDAYQVVYYGLKATDFNTPVTATFVEGDVAVGKVLTYSVKSYVYNHANDTTAFAELIKATYNYGKSAVLYVANETPAVSVVETPDFDKKGLVRISIGGFVEEVEIPEINLNDYAESVVSDFSMNVDDNSFTNGKVAYTLKDTTYGEIKVEKDVSGTVTVGGDTYNVYDAILGKTQNVSYDNGFVVVNLSGSTVDSITVKNLSTIFNVSSVNNLTTLKGYGADTEIQVKGNGTLNIFASGDEAIELRLKEFKTLESVALNASSDTTAVYVHSGLFNINSTSASFTTTTANSEVMKLLDFVVGDGSVAPSVNVTANGNSGISEGNRGIANWTVNSGKLTVAQNVPGYVGFNFDKVGVDHKLVTNGSGEIEVVNYAASVAAWNGANVYIQNNGTFNSIGGWIMVKSIENYGSFTTDMSDTTGDTAAVRTDIVVNGTSEKVANMTILANLNQDALTHYSSGLSMNINSGVLDITRKNTIWEGADGTSHNKNGISSDKNATFNVAEGATIKLWGWGTGINAPNWWDQANNTITVRNSGTVDMYFTVTKTYGHVYFEGNSHIN